MKNRIEVVENESDEAEGADFLVCRRLTSPLLMPDNKLDLCSKCGEAVQYRPAAPNGPAKICEVCVAPVIEGESEIVTMITQKTVDEFDAYMRKKKAH
jgi:hypothetical protein